MTRKDTSRAARTPRNGLGSDHEAGAGRGLRRRREGPSSRSTATSSRMAVRKYSSGSSGRASRRADLFRRAALAFGPERPDGAVGMAVGLEPLEDLLAVVEDRCGRVKRDGAVGFDPRIVPAAFALGVDAVVDDRGVVGEIVAESRVGQDGCTFFSGLRGCREPLAEFDAMGSLGHGSSTVGCLAYERGSSSDHGSILVIRNKLTPDRGADTGAAGRRIVGSGALWVGC